MADDNIERRIILELMKFSSAIELFDHDFKDTNIISKKLYESTLSSLLDYLKQAVDLRMDKMRYNIGGIRPGVTIEVGTYILALKEKYGSKNINKN